MRAPSRPIILGKTKNLNNRKNQNSILVLATLGVYLSLVLAGGTPQILAQAATAKQFSVKDEIEVRDEFEGKPDIEELKSLITNALEGTLATFINDVRISAKSSAGRSVLQKQHSLRTVRNFCAEDWIEVNDPLRSFARGDDAFNDLHRDLDVGLRWEFASVPGFIQTQEGPPRQKFCKTFCVSTSIDSDDLTVKLLFSRTDALNAFRLAGYLNGFLCDRRHLFHDPITEEIYRRTRATSDYASLLVVTRLPRGSLATLLVKDAK